MTEKQFYKSWRKECLKDGVLTIPDCVTELSERMFCGYEDIRKVILPASGVEISDYVFHDCTHYEYVFENGALYNKTNGTWLLYLPDFCNKHLVIPEWFKEVDIRNCDLRNRCNDIRSLKFLGSTDLRSFYAASFEQLESIEFSDKHTVIPADYMFQAFCHCPNLITAKFGCPDCKLDKDVFSGSSSLQSLIGIEHNYNIYGGGIFHQGRVVSVLCDELHYPEGSEWLDDCWGMNTLYLPKSIKYIDKPNEEEMGDRERDIFHDFWSPVYLRVKTIVVPQGYKEYFINLFNKDMQKYKDWWFEEELTVEELEKRIIDFNITSKS